MLKRFGEAEILALTDRNNSGALDMAVLSQALADAFGEMKGYLKGYALPLAGAPANLVRIECDIARYRLYEDRCPEVVKTRYTEAIAYLKLVADGTVTIESDVVAPAASTDVPAFSAPTRIFTSDTLKDL
jgi:phage gp36-like protein